MVAQGLDWCKNTQDLYTIKKKMEKKCFHTTAKMLVKFTSHTYEIPIQCPYFLKSDLIWLFINNKKINY